MRNLKNRIGAQEAHVADKAAWKRGTKGDGAKNTKTTQYMIQIIFSVEGFVNNRSRLSHRILTVTVETFRSALCTVSGGQVVGELMCVIVDAAALLPQGYCSLWL